MFCVQVRLSLYTTLTKFPLKRQKDGGGTDHQLKNYLWLCVCLCGCVCLSVFQPVKIKLHSLQIFSLVFQVLRLSSSPRFTDPFIFYLCSLYRISPSVLLKLTSKKLQIMSLSAGSLTCASMVYLYFQNTVPVEWCWLEKNGTKIMHRTRNSPPSPDNRF